MGSCWLKILYLKQVDLIIGGPVCNRLQVRPKFRWTLYNFRWRYTIVSVQPTFRAHHSTVCVDVNKLLAQPRNCLWAGTNLWWTLLNRLRVQPYFAWALLNCYTSIIGCPVRNRLVTLPDRGPQSGEAHNGYNDPCRMGDPAPHPPT